MPVGEVVRISRFGNAVARIGPYRPEVVLTHHKYDPNTYRVGDIVFIPENQISRREGSYTCYEHRMADSIEAEGYRSPVTRMDLVLYDTLNGYVLCLGRWRDILRDFGLPTDIQFDDEGTLLDKMHALMWAKPDIPHNLRRSAIVFEQGEFKGQQTPILLKTVAWFGRKVELEELIQTKLQQR